MRFCVRGASCIRTKAGMSQGEFARAFCIHLRTLQEWEQGRRNPTPRPAHSWWQSLRTGTRCWTHWRLDLACTSTAAVRGRARNPTGGEVANAGLATAARSPCSPALFTRKRQGRKTGNGVVGGGETAGVTLRGGPPLIDRRQETIVCRTLQPLLSKSPTF